MVQAFLTMHVLWSVRRITLHVRLHASTTADLLTRLNDRILMADEYRVCWT